MHIPLPPLQPFVQRLHPLATPGTAHPPCHAGISTTSAYEALHAALICCFLCTAAVLDKVKAEDQEAVKYACSLSVEM